MSFSLQAVKTRSAKFVINVVYSSTENKSTAVDSLVFRKFTQIKRKKKLGFPKMQEGKKG